MTPTRSAIVPDTGTLVLGTALLAVTVAAWVLVLRSGSSMNMSGSADMSMPMSGPDAMPMAMPGTGAMPSVAEGALFIVQWGVMMAAMMLPSAAPMILLYRTVSRRLAAEGDRVLPVALFAAVYLLLWLLLGAPVYAGYVGLAALAARWPSFNAAMPYGVAAVLVAAGIYQLTDAKRVCLRYCESPLSYLMRRWRSGYGATLRLAVGHASYCIGCCWGLMLILVAAGAMSIPWVLAIAVVVFAEKLLPHGWRTARWVGVGLIVLGVAVALRPALAVTLRG